MSHIRPIPPEKATGVLAPIYEGITDLLGRVANSYRTMAHAPYVAQVMLPLTVTRGVLPTSQPRSAVEALRTALDKFDDFHLAAVGHATGLTGSIVVALALAAARITAEEAFDAASIDEAYQQETWGADAEAAARLEHQRREIVATDRFLRLLDR